MNIGKTFLYFYKKCYINIQTFFRLLGKPAVVAVGDSWFNLTLFNFNIFKRIDTIDYLKKDLNVIDCSIPGYKLEEEREQKLYRSPIKTLAKKQDYLLVLLSLGGNDILWTSFKKSLINVGGKVQFDASFFKRSIRLFLDSYLNYIYNMIKYYCDNGGNRKNIKVLIHGYDYLDATKDYFGLYGKGSLTNLLRKLDISDDKVNILLYKAIDLVNDMIKTNFEDIEEVHYVDLRNSLEYGKDHWEDIHPTPEGYEKIANKLFDYIKLNINKEYYK